MRSVHSDNADGSTKTFNVWVHGPEFSKQNVVLNPDCVPGVTPGALFEVYHPDAANDRMKRLVVRVDAIDTDIIRDKPMLQVRFAILAEGLAAENRVHTLFDRFRFQHTLLRSLASHEEVRSWFARYATSLIAFTADSSAITMAVLLYPPVSLCCVLQVDVKSVTADYIELTFRDQYIGRSDMWRLSRYLSGSCVFIEQKIKFAECIRAQAKKIYIKGDLVMSTQFVCTCVCQAT
jgi:hypothetical protein